MSSPEPALTPPSSAAFLLSEKTDNPARRLSPWRLAGISAAILGVQVFWSILMAHGNPFLAELGFSSALSSLVWLAGPLSGAIVQPIVGVWSDAWQIKSSGLVARLGRRKPFILAGAVTAAISLFALAYVREVFNVLKAVMGVSGTSMATASTSKESSSWVLKAMAIFWVYFINLAIQPLQVGVRAYVIDCAPPDQQVEASAWISRWNSFGAVLAFWLGSLDLPSMLPGLGTTQLQVLSFAESFVLLVTIPISFASGRGLDNAALHNTSQKSGKKSFLDIWKRLYKTWKVMPRTSWRVCKVQFWAWMAWFPFLYYNTMYIGSLETSARGAETPPKDVSMMTPQMGHLNPGGVSTQPATHPPADVSARAAQAGSFASFLFALTSLGFTLLLPTLLQYTSALDVQKLWLGAHVLFATIMALTVFANNVTTGTALVACLGFSWAMTQWAPYALISKEISRLEAEAKEDREAGFDGVQVDAGGAGAILGLHNIAIAGPQIIAAVECSILFGLFGGLGVKEETGWTLRMTGLAALGAAWMAKDLVGRKI